MNEPVDPDDIEVPEPFTGDPGDGVVDIDPNQED